MSKTGRQIQVMSRLRNILSDGNKMLLYNSFAECYFNYCSIISNFCSKANSLKLEKLQMKALKLMAANFDASYGILPLTYNKASLFTVVFVNVWK